LDKIGIAADTKPLEANVKQAEGVVEGFKSNLLAMGAAAGAAFLSFEAIKGLYEWVKGAGEAINQARVMADRVGMSSEAFNKLSYAATAAGIDEGTFAMSVEQMNKRLGELAVEGTGPAADALKRFGLSARQLAEQGPEASFEKLVGVLGSIKNPAERAAVAMDLFGKSGQAILNLAEKGPGGLKELEEEAQKLGIATSNVDAEKVREAEHAWNQIWTAVQGLGRTIAVELAPHIAYVADAFSDWVKRSNGFAVIGSAIHDFVLKPIYIVADVVKFVESALLSLGAAGVQAFADLAKGAAGFSAAISGQGKAAGAGARKGHWGGPDWGAILGDGAAPAAEAKQPGKSGFLEGWADALQKKSDEMQAHAFKLWNEIGKGLDDVTKGAEDRAKAAADRSAAFRAPGALSPLEPPKAKPKEKEFAGAFTLGSKEAYSAIVQSRGQFLSQNDAKVTAKNTGEAAAELKGHTAILTKIAAGLDRAGGGNLATSVHNH
jgi:hypothetical protein